jgi:hypothetical protein
MGNERLEQLRPPRLVRIAPGTARTWRRYALASGTVTIGMTSWNDL